MTAVATTAAAAVAEAHRREWATVLAATVRVTRDLDLAEECVQDAYAQALTQWQDDGPPLRPGAWLTTVARRRALDLVRREATGRRLLPLLIEPEPVQDEADDFPDDRLRLMFICCHPALPPDAQIALTLRLVCGLRTPEVARAFLVSEPTMAARITRAKKKIAQARDPVQGAGAGPAAGATRRRTLRGAPGLHRRPHRRRGQRPGPPRPRPSARSTWPGSCARCCRPTATSPACWP